MFWICWTLVGLRKLFFDLKGNGPVKGLKSKSCVKIIWKEIASPLKYNKPQIQFSNYSWLRLNIVATKRFLETTALWMTFSTNNNWFSGKTIIFYWFGATCLVLYYFCSLKLVTYAIRYFEFNVTGKFFLTYEQVSLSLEESH